MKIALAQQNCTIGDFEGIRRKMEETIGNARSRGADLVVFPELSICGYPPHDLLERKDFVEESRRSLEELATRVPDGMGVLVGGPEFNTGREGKLLFNAAFFLEGGAIRQIFRKSLLPTYDIFDEYRYFEPNRTFHLLNFREKKLAVTICEDLWDNQPFESEFSRNRLYRINPMEELHKLGPDVVVNLAASPFSHRKMEVKQSIFTQKAREFHLPVLYCNQVGAHTELIFEGGSLAVDSNGVVRERLAYFREETRVIDLDELEIEGLPSPPAPSRIACIADALECGIRDYFGKMGFRKATLGLSGGIDSAVTLVLAARALGPGALHVLLLPSPYSSDHSIDDSVRLAQNLNVSHTILPIGEIFGRFKDTLRPLFGDRAEDLTEENIQARIRGTLLMALSNKMGNILLNTSNKSETAVGYGTLYGDMSGGLSVLGDVYKMDVYALARYLNREEEIIPDHILTKAPSAELRPDQKDSDSLPPYDLLDAILEEYIEKQIPPSRIALPGSDPELVRRIVSLVDRNEYKRYQTPPILRISSKAFGTGRRLPLVAKF
ncbi:MAG: NAD+ synthase [Bacteroidales bacterium]